MGIVSENRWRRYEEKSSRIAGVLERLKQHRHGESNLLRYLHRTEVTWEEVTALCPELADTPRGVVQQVVSDVKYEGYVVRQHQHVAKQQRLAEKRIPTNFDYERITQLRREAREKLTRVRPITLAQASRISGITPADVAVLLVHL